MEEVEVCGYPGDKDAHTMWYAKGKYETAHETFFTHKISTFGGQSGSPFLKRKNGIEYIIGIHIGSNLTGSKNVALRLTRQIRRFVNSWVG